MKDLITCDMHCDTATNIYDKRLNLDLSLLANTQFFAVFIAPEYYNNPKKRCFDVINYMYNEISNNNEKIGLCKNFSDITDNRINAFLSIEGGEAVTSVDDLKLFYDLGIRMLTLTWNNDNLIGGANGSKKGLTAFGKEIIKKMNELGMIADLSHANEKTFFEACTCSEKPVVLSHSNSYTVCPHQRNITAEQFEEIKRLNGCVGINFYPTFLNNKDSADIYDIVSHIEYFLSLGGENNISLGSDFDGIDRTAKGISSAKDIYKIFNVLASMGISDEIIKKFAYKNIYRVLSICL